MELLKAAWKNIRRNRRRSILNIIALTVGMTIMLAALGWVRGYFTTLYQGMMRFDTGQVQILHREYLPEKRRLPLDLTAAPYAEFRRGTAAMEGVAAAAGRINYQLELGNGQETMPMMGRGIDPVHERKITTLEEHLTEGRYLRPGEEGVLLGVPAAEKLGVGVGDSVYLRVRDRYSAPNVVAYPVVGLFELGYPLMDRGLAVTDVERTAEFLRTGGGVTRLVLWLEDGEDPKGWVEDVWPRERNKLTAAGVPSEAAAEVQAYPWQDFAQTMIAAVKADSGSFTLLMIILFLLIFLGILNSMSMAVQERGQEIGTLRAIGMKKGQLSLMLIAESIFLALIAMALSSAVGGGLAAYVQNVGMDVSGYMPEDLPIPFGERFYGDYRLVDFFLSGLLGVFTAVLGSLIPVRRAARLEIVETMRMGHV